MRRYLRLWINAKMIIAAIIKPMIPGLAARMPSGVLESLAATFLQLSAHAWVMGARRMPSGLCQNTFKIKTFFLSRI
jgi:hypothetical protein